MRIGFAAIYSWRPHVEHLHFLAMLARKGGHETHFLTCDGDLAACYTREMRDRPQWRECLECRLGGIRSYETSGVTPLRRYRASSGVPTESNEWVLSSASTLGRFESDADYDSAEFAAIAEKLRPAVELGFVAARDWIRENRLDAVCVFNGRMDVTRAIFEAARSLGVRVVSVERTWFSDGLQLYPDENCLGLRAVTRLVRDWKDRPLARDQAIFAASHVARRFLRTNVNEWRAYNTNAQALGWPVNGARRRILLIPSSRNEVWGHPDWKSCWTDPTSAYDALIDRFRLERTDVVLRCHPNWSEKIGAADGSFSERHFANWARQRGILSIASSDKASTLSLIEQCDSIVVSNGSAAMEAGVLGKQVIATGPSFYQAAGIRDDATTPGEIAALELWSDLDPPERQRRGGIAARQTIRFLYTMIRRVAQYSSAVRALKTTKFVYDFSADPARFIDLLATGELKADDDRYAADSRGEDEVLGMVHARDWRSLVAGTDAVKPVEMRPLKRRLSRRPVDWISKRKPVGDR